MSNLTDVLSFVIHVLSFNYRKSRERLYRSFFYQLRLHFPELGAPNDDSFQSREKMVRFWFHKLSKTVYDYQDFLRIFSRSRKQKHVRVLRSRRKSCARNSGLLPSSLKKESDWRTTQKGFSPLFWGPAFWSLLHHLEANTRQKSRVIHLTKSLCKILPCRECRVNVKKALPVLDKTSMSAEDRLKRFHFLVNCHLGKSKNRGKSINYKLPRKLCFVAS